VEHAEPNLIKRAVRTCTLKSPGRTSAGCGRPGRACRDRGGPLRRPRSTPCALPGRERRRLFLGMGKKHLFLVPVEEVSHEASEEERVTVNLNRDKVVGSPEFDPDEVPKVNLQRAVYAYYGYSSPEGT